MHGLVIIDINIDRDLFDDFEGIGQGVLEGLNNDDGVDVTLELGKGLCENFASYSQSETALSYNSEMEG